MTKHDWLQNIRAKTKDTAPLSMEKLDLVLSAAFAEITAALASGERWRWPDFGTMYLKETITRMGRNPQTGEPLEIPARTLVRFKPGEAMQEAVQPKPVAAPKAKQKPAKAVASKGKKARRAA